MSAQCYSCKCTLQGSWNMTKAGAHYEAIGRYLGVYGKFYTTGENPGWVYSCCDACYQKTVLSQINPAIAQLNQQISNLTAQVNTKNSQVATMQTEINNKANQIANLNTDAQNKANQIATLTADLANKNNQIAALTAQLQSLQQTHIELTGKLQQKESSFQAEISDLNSKNKALEDRVNSLLQENFILRASIKIDPFSEEFKVEQLNFAAYKQELLNNIFIYAAELYSKINSIFNNFNETQIKSISEKSDVINFSNICTEILPKLRASGEETIGKLRLDLSHVIKVMIEEDEGKMNTMDKIINSLTEVMQGTQLYGNESLMASLQPAKTIKETMNKDKEEWHKALFTVTLVN